ncbi:phage major capsid protein [Vibrio mytili]|uniref:phage major capsid protein n=1 Tax=Vibrio mytili TaxID=50718 RepID=UPI002F405186
MSEFKEVLEAIGGLETKQKESVAAVQAAIETKQAELAQRYEAQNKELEAKNAEMAERLQALESKSIAGKKSEGGLDFGAQVVASAEFKGAVESRQARKIEIKAASSPTTTANTTLATQLAGVVGIPNVRPSVYNLLNKITTSTGVADFIREVSFDNATAEVPEGTAKPMSKTEFEHVSMPIPTVAHYIKVSEQFLADAPAVASLLNARMGGKLLEVVDKNIITGLQSASNSTPVAGAQGDTIYASIRKAIAALETDGFTATAIILHPEDAATLDLDKTASDEYRNTDARSVNAPVAWGLPVVKSSAMTKGQFIVLDGAFVSVIERQGATVEMGFDADDFTKNLRTLRAEMRVTAAVFNKAAVRTGAITTP